MGFIIKQVVFVLVAVMLSMFKKMNMVQIGVVAMYILYNVEKNNYKEKNRAYVGEVYNNSNT